MKIGSKFCSAGHTMGTNNSLSDGLHREQCCLLNSHGGVVSLSFHNPSRLAQMIYHLKKMRLRAYLWVTDMPETLPKPYRTSNLPTIRSNEKPEHVVFRFFRSQPCFWGCQAIEEYRREAQPTEDMPRKRLTGPRHGDSLGSRRRPSGILPSHGGGSASLQSSRR